MHVLIFVILAIAAVSCTTIVRGRQSTEPAVCPPDSIYSASTNDVYGGATCHCNDNGSIGYCYTIYHGTEFLFTQTSSDKRKNLGMCLDGTCFKLPLKRDLPNLQCEVLIQPSSCTAEQNGKTYSFVMSLPDDVVDGSVNVNGTTYEILPVVINGRVRQYL